ncbi:MAG: LysR family transcriptional regulator [Candidatus Riflebacteria bacterium]|nr:LysR family transcriptional regulator [Candidatus Riflebacteria bacterium]
MKEWEILDSKLFQAFFAASRTLNFTKAAEIIGMTQSGVTQQIHKLEGQLGAPLFSRVGKRVFLSSAGKHLLHYVERYLDESASLKEKIRNEFSVPSGLVRYAMPESCLGSPHFEHLLKGLKKDFPNISLKVTLCPSQQVFRKLLTGEIDFGFVTRNSRRSAFDLTLFCKEEYILVGAEKRFEKKIPEDFFQKNKFLLYPGFQSVFKNWKKVNLPNDSLGCQAGMNFSGEINNLNGIITMLEHGMGTTVLSKHCVKTNIENESLLQYGKSQFQTVENAIYIAELRGSQFPRKVMAVIDIFKQIYKGKKW